MQLWEVRIGQRMNGTFLDAAWFTLGFWLPAGHSDSPFTSLGPLSAAGKQILQPPKAASDAYFTCFATEFPFQPIPTYRQTDR